MSFQTPELLLVGLPLAWVLWRTTSFPSWRFLLRGLVLVALLAALAGIHGGGDVRGRDVVLLVDRSRSMPAGTTASATELAALLHADLRPGDRLAVMSFAAGTALEHGLDDDAAFAGFREGLDPDDSRLAEALDRALALIPENRPGSILLLSDGEFHGAMPDDAARRAALRGVRLDVRGTADSSSGDVAVERLDLPETVGLGERFQFTAWVHADRATDAAWRLLRGEEVIARGTRSLSRGRNQLLFRDVAARPGLQGYRLVVEAPGDAITENDRGLGVTRVEGRRPLLLVNATGEAGRLTAALRGAGLAVEVRAPGQLDLADPVWLDRWSGVVLENVAADELAAALPDLATHVQDLGLGLLLTGGRASFGVGGYYRSALEPVLPVTMELRVEHRKMALALAVVLDRSGSMSARVDDGRTKMDLANAGTIEAVRLLGAIDEVAVIAVDSADHVVVPLRPVDDLDGIAKRISGIESMGGGIFTYTGLLSAAHELEGARAGNRHILLFADAADAEEPGQYVELLEQLVEERSTTVSVVALGRPDDTDADFLRDVAQRGGGEIYFTTSAAELPRLFAQDTLLAARSAFVEEPTASRATGALTAISPTARPGPWATLPGYNLTYLRPQATLGVQTTDEFGAPLVATLQAGLGRTAAFTGQVDGAHGVPAGAWPEVAEMLVTLARWIAGTEPPARYFPSVRRDGREAVVALEVDRGPALGEVSDEAFELHLVRPDGTTRVTALPRVGPDRYALRLPLGGEGVYRIAAHSDRGEVVPMAPLAVPYSPEFAVRDRADDGLATLGRLARLGRGTLNPAVHQVLAGDRTSPGLTSWVRHAALAALLLLLGEILWRRWYERRVVARAVPVNAGATTARAARVESKSRAREPVSPSRATVPTPAATTTPAPDEAGTHPAESDERTPSPEEAAPSLEDTLRKVRGRRRR